MKDNKRKNSTLLTAVLVVCIVILLLVVVKKGNNGSITGEGKNLNRKTASEILSGKGKSVKKPFALDEVILPEQLSDETLREISRNIDNEQTLNKIKGYWIGRIKEEMEPVFRILHKYVQPGDTVADIGCGGGYYTFLLSEYTGPDGKVYAIDVNPLAILSQIIHRREMAKKYGSNRFTNIISLINDEKHLHMDMNSVDVAFLSDVHILHINMGEVITDSNGKSRNIEREKIEKHGKEYQQKQLFEIIDRGQKDFLKEIYDTLKTKGLFIIAEDMKGAEGETKLGNKRLIELLKKNRFKLVEDASLSDYHILVFQKK